MKETSEYIEGSTITVVVHFLSRFDASSACRWGLAKSHTQKETNDITLATELKTCDGNNNCELLLLWIDAWAFSMSSNRKTNFE